MPVYKLPCNIHLTSGALRWGTGSASLMNTADMVSIQIPRWVQGEGCSRQQALPSFPMLSHLPVQHLHVALRIPHSTASAQASVQMKICMDTIALPPTALLSLGLKNCKLEEWAQKMSLKGNGLTNGSTMLTGSSTVRPKASSILVSGED